MTHTEIIVALRLALLPRLPGVSIVQGYQPTTQGAPDGPTLILYPIGDVDYGWVSRRDEWRQDLGRFVYTERQVRETTFQVNATSPGAAIGEETPAELSARARMHLRSWPVLTDLRAAGLSILRVRDTRFIPVPEADGGQPENNPSFDVTVRHSDILAATTPAVESTAVIIERA